VADQTPSYQPSLSDTDVANKLADHSWITQMVSNFASVTWANRLSAMSSFGGSGYQLAYTYGWK
jgi:hypothetical protein